MGYQDITYEKDDRLAFIALNRPDKLNALSNNIRGELMDAMREAELREYGFVVADLRGIYFVKDLKDEGYSLDDLTKFVCPESCNQ